MIVAVVAVALVAVAVVLMAERPWRRPPPPLTVEIRVDTTEYRAAMRRAGASMAKLGRRR